MNMPGFTAEASLYQTSERYAVNGDWTRDNVSAALQPAGIFDILLDPCSYCFRTCANQNRTLSGGRDCLDACRFSGLC